MRAKLIAASMAFEVRTRVPEGVEGRVRHYRKEFFDELHVGFKKTDIAL